MLIGIVLGILSLQVRRETTLPYAWLRITNVLATPAVSGFLARRAAQRRNLRGQPSSPRDHLSFAVALTLALVLVRFVYCVRPR
jgi:hypothetical protein